MTANAHKQAALFRFERVGAPGWKRRLLGLEPFLYLLPIFLIFGVFVFYPLLGTLRMSVSLVDSMGVIVEGSGLENYRELAASSDFWNSLQITLIFAVLVVPLEIVSGVGLGLLAENRLRRSSPLRVAYALPMAISSACASVIWLMMFNPTVGVVNYLLGMQLNWLSDKNLALVMVVITTVWLSLGSNFIYAFSGLQGIPQELYECAAIEGAGYLKTLVHITLPCMSPTLFFLLVTNTIGAFQTFTQVSLMTQGGPANYTNVLSYAIYREAFFNNRWGFACAQSLVFLAILLLISLIQFQLEKKGVFYQ